MKIRALDTFTSVSCNAEALMSERFAFAGSLLQISLFTLGTGTVTITWLLIFLENFLSLLHRLLCIKFPIY